MIHIIVDRDGDKSFLSAQGTAKEIKEDFAVMLEGMKDNPLVLSLFIDVMTQFSATLRRELENDQNDSSNKG